MSVMKTETSIQIARSVILIKTRDNYKKGRKNFKLCYNYHVLANYKNRFCLTSSPKPDGST